MTGAAHTPTPAQSGHDNGRTTIGVDVGGTTIKAAAARLGFDGIATVGPVVRRRTPSGDPGAVIERIGVLVEAVRERTRADGVDEPEAVGVAIPGIVDEARGVAVYAALFGWAGTPVASEVAAATGLPVRLGHDVRAAGLIESRLGAARGVPDALVVVLGTGIGAAVVVDGRLLVADGYAGQLGHTAVPAAGATVCRCGQTGCVATVASASAIARRYADRRADVDPAGDSRVVGDDADEAERVAELASSGDPDAVEVWDQAVGGLSQALATAVTVFGPEMIVLGGGLAQADESLLLDPLSRRLKDALTFQRMPQIVPAVYRHDAGVLGAALLGAVANPA